MNKDGIENWAERFVADLDVGGERVPLDRVIGAHLPVLKDLRASGLTWRSIAAIIARAGGRRANGRLISPDQLRADVSRLTKRGADATASAAVTAPVPSCSPIAPLTAAQSSKTGASTLSPPARRRSRPTPLPEPSANPSIPIPSGGPKDVSDTDIATALARLKLHS